MLNEAKAMQEIHEIRAHIYEETKNMTITEYNARVRRHSKALLERYGIKLKRVEPSKTLTSGRPTQE